MNTRAAAILAVVALSTLAGCAATGAPTNLAANRTDSAVMSDTSPTAAPDRDDDANAVYRALRFRGGWWKDH